jgi:hypothetical protein
VCQSRLASGGQRLAVDVREHQHRAAVGVLGYRRHQPVLTPVDRDGSGDSPEVEPRRRGRPPHPTPGRRPGRQPARSCPIDPDGWAYVFPSLSVARHNGFVPAGRNAAVTESDAPTPVPPAVAEGDRWELVETDQDTFGHERLVTVNSTRALYGDRALRERVRAATGRDRLWRAVFVSRLTTQPPLSPRIADLVVRSIAFPRARSEFADDLADRGFADVTEADRRRIAVGDSKARAARFEAVVPPADSSATDDGVAVNAWLALWDRETDMVAGGGIYPVGRLPDAPEAFEAPGTYRSQLFDLLGAMDAVE